MKQTILNALREDVKGSYGYYPFERKYLPLIEALNIPKTNLSGLYKDYIICYFGINHLKTKKAASPLVPYWQYIANKNCPDNHLHRVLNNKIFAFNDPIWAFFLPPNDYNCECRVKALDEDQIKDKNLIVETSKNKLFVEKVNNIDLPVYMDHKTGLNISPHPDWCFDISQIPFEQIETMLINHYLN